jgi:hypothetical protein
MYCRILLIENSRKCKLIYGDRKQNNSCLRTMGRSEGGWQRGKQRTLGLMGGLVVLSVVMVS